MIGLWTRTDHEEERATERTEENPAQRPTLHYAPVKRALGTRRWFNRVALTTFAFGAIAFTIGLAKRVESQFRLIRYQQQEASAQVGPPDQVVFRDRALSVNGLVFVHRRVSDDREPRIVRVSVFGSGTPIAFRYQTRPMRSMWDLGNAAPERSGWIPAWRRPVTLYAGQPDPADESHFTIAYESQGQKGTIDGWLMHDETVKLEVRDGPLR